jgi:8-oxo-dGTP pyrophosphatase MutT (NUDIX family)
MRSFPTLTIDQIHILLKDKERSNTVLSSFPLDFFPEPSQPAAVLILFLQIRNEWHLLFIRRTHHPRDPHGGQVSFPGGRFDASDANLESTALREAEEELGLNPGNVRILGKLPPMLTITNYLVTPFVGFIPWPYPIQPHPEEVSRVFTIPINWLANPLSHYILTRAPEANRPTQVEVIYFHPYDGEILWGATARMTLNLLTLLEIPIE